MLVDASRIGQQIKVDEVLKTVFSSDDERVIVNAIAQRENNPEFSVEIDVERIEDNGNLIKPGLYFEMQYPNLKNYIVDMSDEMQKMKQRKAGLIRVLRSAYAKNLIIKWFVDFDFPGKSGIYRETEYGKFPIELDLLPLHDLISDTLGGEWGKENPEGRYDVAIKCIRGTDIPNIAKSYYDNIPLRYVQKKHITGKQVRANDIIIEISGGSPIQSTGRVCFISEDILQDLDLPVLCTNFCRVVRLKESHYAEFVYSYILLLYSRGYFYNLENNTTGIKNLIFNSFTHSIKVPFPKNRGLLDSFLLELDKYCQNIQI
jgi:type I restriction enzyme S subunit